MEALKKFFLMNPQSNVFLPEYDDEVVSVVVKLDDL